MTQLAETNVFFRFFDALLARHAPSQLEVDGARLQAIGRRIWVADRELAMAGGVRFPVRMVVIGNETGELMCYSPVSLDADTIEAIGGVGDVRWIVAPNAHHTLFVRECQQVFPNAQVLAPGPVKDCAPQIIDSQDPRSGRIGEGFEALAVDLRPEFTELVLYHDLSETLIVSDLLFNIHAGSRRLRWFMRLNGAWQREGHTRLQRLLLIKNRHALGEFYRWAFARPFGQISMSHGQVISADAREVFYQIFHPYMQD